MLYSNVVYTFILNSISQYPIILYFVVLLYYNFTVFFSSCIVIVCFYL